jgi:hypothetical protein
MPPPVLVRDDPSALFCCSDHRRSNYSCGVFSSADANLRTLRSYCVLHSAHRSRNLNCMTKVLDNSFFTPLSSLGTSNIRDIKSSVPMGKTVSIHSHHPPDFLLSFYHSQAEPTLSPPSLCLLPITYLSRSLLPCLYSRLLTTKRAIS